MSGSGDPLTPVWSGLLNDVVTVMGLATMALLVRPKMWDVGELAGRAAVHRPVSECRVAGGGGVDCAADRLDQHDGDDREPLVEMDVPTRQSYVLAIVDPAERTFASGLTNVTRNVGWAIGPAVAGVMMGHVAFAGPLAVGGGLKIAYDLMLYGSFRHLRPAEEQRSMGRQE